MSQPKRVSFHTLGCKLNYSETSTIARQFEEGGFVRVPQRENADICIINTCSVTDNADKKCRNMIRRFIRRNPEAIVAVTGCYAQLKPEEIGEIKGVDIVLSNNHKGELYNKVAELSKKQEQPKIYSCDVEQLTNFFASFSTGDRTRAFLKVQDGCSYNCTYCTIPLARGESRNTSIATLVAEAEKIAAEGQKEIVITGINTGDFGRTTGEKFADLLCALDEVEGVERYRISSIEPNLLTDEIIEITKESKKFQPHFHIPLQSGSDHILGLMRRRYNSATFAERIEAARRAMPNSFFGIDVIVGFPGETDEHFEETYNLLKQVNASYLHVFPYSERANTPAIEFEGKVEPQVSAERVHRLTELSEELHREFYEQFVGTEGEVLFESNSHKGMMSGFTHNYIRVKVPYNRQLVNKIVRVRLDSIDERGDMLGTVVE